MTSITASHHPIYDHKTRLCNMAQGGVGACVQGLYATAMQKANTNHISRISADHSSLWIVIGNQRIEWRWDYDWHRINELKASRLG